MTGEEQLTDDDFEREGLLDGIGPAERQTRLDLLGQLAARGITLEELKRAVAQDRLALLPIEVVLRDQGPYTFASVRRKVGTGPEFLRRDFLALGFPVPDPR